MTAIGPCNVHYNDGRTVRDTEVLFKDNGWIRVGTQGSYTYYPPGAVDHIQREVPQPGGKG